MAACLGVPGWFTRLLSNGLRHEAVVAGPALVLPRFTPPGWWWWIWELWSVAFLGWSCRSSLGPRWPGSGFGPSPFGLNIGIAPTRCFSWVAGSALTCWRWSACAGRLSTMGPRGPPPGLLTATSAKLLWPRFCGAAGKQASRVVSLGLCLRRPSAPWLFCGPPGRTSWMCMSWPGSSLAIWGRLRPGEPGLGCGLKPVMRRRRGRACVCLGLLSRTTTVRRTALVRGRVPVSLSMRAPALPLPCRA